MWSLGCTILQFLLDTDTWNVSNFMKQFGVIDESLALEKVCLILIFFDSFKQMLLPSIKIHNSLSTIIFYNQHDRFRQ